MSLFVNTIKSKEARFRTSLDPFEHLRSRGNCNGQRAIDSVAV